MSAVSAFIAPAGAAVISMLGGKALTKDLQMQAVENDNKHVYVRAFSQATADPSRSPHWYFLAASVLYAACIVAVALWQHAANMPGAAASVILASISGALFFLMAVVPNFEANTFQKVLHSLLAGGAIATGLSWSVRAAFGAIDDDPMLFWYRMGCVIFGALGTFGMLMGGLYLYFTASDKVRQIEKGELTVLPEEEIKLRRRLVPLAVFQSMCGLCITAVLGSGAAEIRKLKQDDWVPGLVSFFVILLITGSIAAASYWNEHNRCAKSAGTTELA
mmetsp:Transcript_7876/g.16853  ORF Transcript_7876/g.16853 Transcript_7876/m.16853 type:complete len:276 (+) Transcript_7876:219-1046(+)